MARKREARITAEDKLRYKESFRSVSDPVHMEVTDGEFIAMGSSADTVNVGTNLAIMGVDSVTYGSKAASCIEQTSGDDKSHTHYVRATIQNERLRSRLSEIARTGQWSR